MMLNRIKNKSGFTLLEIIIAIGILAAMTFTMTEITVGITLSRDRTNKRNETRHAISNGLSKLMFDVRQAFHVKNKFQGRNNAYLTGFIGTSTSMSFSTMSNVHFVKNNKDTDQVQVEYSLKTGESEFFDLVRRQTDYLESDIESGGKTFVLIPNVRDFTLEYYDSNKEAWQGEWRTDSISSGGRLPQVVKVNLLILGESLNADGDEFKEYEYEILIPIEMYANKITF